MFQIYETNETKFIPKNPQVLCDAYQCITGNKKYYYNHVLTLKNQNETNCFKNETQKIPKK
jgi:hypothetical protein